MIKVHGITNILRCETFLESVSLGHCWQPDVASTTYELTDYLVRFGTPGVWPSATASRSVVWANGVATQNDGGPLANYVQATKYSIGFAKKKTAASRAIGLGALKGKFGTFVPPTDAAFQMAATTTSLPLPAQDTWSDMSMGQQTTSAWAYPATHFSYFIVLPYRNAAGQLNWPDDTAGYVLVCMIVLGVTLQLLRV